MSVIDMKRCTVPLREKDLPFGDGVEFFWLGQSGFLISLHGKLILLDAYLSNYLVTHDTGLPYSHERMMSSPLDESVLPLLDYVLITHGHEDHLDPELIPQIDRVNPGVRFLIPPGCRKQMENLGIQKSKIKDLNHDQSHEITDGFLIEAFPAAHPKPDFNPRKTWALSYHLYLDGVSLFFAGDTTLYPELIDWLMTKKIDLLVLPVNGRDPKMEANGIVGNMKFEEAVILSLMLRTPFLGTHYGMFAFNTVDPDELKQAIRNYGMEDRIFLSEAARIYTLT